MSIGTDAPVVAGTLDDRTKEGMIAELKQLRIALDEADRVKREFGDKRQSLEATLRAYGVNVDTLES